MEDIVNVVRCKDCVFRMYSYICPMKNIYYDGDNEVGSGRGSDNGYCDLGKKKSKAVDNCWQ